MALTAIEQLKIIAGDVGPNETDLLSLVLQTGVINGVDFIINGKDTSGNVDAASYYTKYASVVYRLFNNNIDTATSLRRIITVILGNTPYTNAQISGASDAQWQGFIAEKIGAGIEYLAQITNIEKTAYNNL